MYLEQIGFHHLLTLRTLFKTGSVRQTASILGRTQPAISLQIKALEAIIGFDVITHRRGQLAFTSQGAWLAKRTEDVIEQMEGAVRQAAAIGRPPIRIGITEDFIRREMKDISPLIDSHRIDLYVQCSSLLMSRFYRGELDIVVAKGLRPIKGALRVWLHELTWSTTPIKHRNRGIELVLLSNGCLYHHVAIKTLTASAQNYCIRSVCNSWDGIYSSLACGGTTVVARNWPGNAPIANQDCELPSLPPATINILVARGGGDDFRHECLDWVDTITGHLNMSGIQRII